MKIGVLGTGGVGQTLAGKLAELGHEVMVGTRDVAQTLGRTAPDGRGNPSFATWLEGHTAVQLGTFAEATAHGELIVNATNGSAALEILHQAGADNLAGKALLDVTNPLDFSQGMPPTLFVKDSDSLAEQIQRTFPEAHVVKSLNTLTAHLMVNPRALADGAHTVFVSGNDSAAKAQVTTLLESFGWQDIIDLGDISTARGTEMWLPIWLRLWGALQTPSFNLKIVR
ncbi:MAG: NAD(P)-binding domain-containing protein [Chloroflexi bacterium]|nr:NAD(P)-binding domain-containing protein [Chloroflexota bacterium]